MKRENYTPADFAELAKVNYSNPCSVIFNKYTDINALDCLFEHAPSYFFIIDYIKIEYLYVSRSVKNVLGYPKDYFLKKGLEFLFSAIHIEDKLRLRQIHEKMFSYYYSTPVRERTNLKFAINYRVRRNDEKHITLLHEIVFTDIATDGTPLIDFNTCTDISSYKTENSLKVIIYKKVDQSYNQVYEYKINEQIDLLTQRQIEILNLLSKGYTTCQIAEKLFLSEETVKIHRKNILHRTGAKNSIQAVNLLMNGDLASNHVSTRMNNVHHSLV